MATNKRVNLVDHTKAQRRRIVLEGLSDIMFDRYPGDNKTELEPWQKIYLDPRDAETICIPSINIMSALTAQNTDSFPKSLRDPRAYKKFCHQFASQIIIEEQFIPFLNKKNKPILFGKFDGDSDKRSGMYIHRTVARLEKGIPNPKVRPVLPTYYQLVFHLVIAEGNDKLEQDLVNILSEGLTKIGLGTYRRIFGRMKIVEWENVRRKP